MYHFTKIIGLLLAFLIVSCASNPSPIHNINANATFGQSDMPSISGFKDTRIVNRKSINHNSSSSEVRKIQAPQASKTKASKPNYKVDRARNKTFKEHKTSTPKKEQLLSFHSKGIPLEIAIKTILRGIKPSIIWDNSVDKNRLTQLDYTNISRSDALKYTINSAGYGVRFENNTIFIDSAIYSVFRLPPLAGKMEVSRTIGGDSQGSSGNTGNNSNAGSTTSSGATKTITQNTSYDFYKSLKKNLDALKSDNGIVTVNSETQLVTLSDDFKHSNQIRHYIKNIWNVYSYEAFLDIRILEVQLSKSHASGIKWDITGKVLQNRAGGTIALSTTGQFLPTVTASPVAALGLTINNAAGTTIDLLMQQLEEYGKVKTLYKPKAHVYNGKPIKIDDTKIDDIASNITSIDTGGIGAATTTVTTESIITGLQFDLTPYIYNENTMLVEIAPRISTNNGATTLNLNGGNQIQLKHLSSRELFLSSTLKNGQTQVFGGIIFEKNSNSKNEPMISKIPFIGELFKRKQVSSEKSELVITITPYIRKMNDIGTFEISSLEGLNKL